MNGVWIVDDDQSIRWVLERALMREGYAVRAFERAADCLQALQTDQPRALVSDIRMPGVSGIDMLLEIRDRYPDIPVIVMTAYSDLDSAVSAFRSGAFEYLAKPFDLVNAIELIRRAVDEGARPTDAAVSVGNGMGMLGNAPAMQEVFRAIGRLSNSPVTVLITGESGTGKELVAHALHKHSVRADKPFVALNTAAIPHELLESELFGHERGAFTGAQQQRRGRFEQAQGGTLFLDEIGDMPAELQTRLLRVLSDGVFSRVGGMQSIRADVRVIAATHQRLEDRVRQGLFREDLFHRLNVIRIRLPALRERREDIPMLVRHFLNEAAAEMGTTPKRLTDDALHALQAMPWPGNVRQLENACRWITVMSSTQTIGPGDLPPELRTPVDQIALLSPHAENMTVRRETGAAVGADRFSGATWEPGPANGAAPSHHRDNGQAAPTPVDQNDLEPWVQMLAGETARRLEALSRDPRADGVGDIMRELTRQFESTILSITLRHTGGRRIDAARMLGLGRNTITRKVQELGLPE